MSSSAFPLKSVTAISSFENKPKNTLQNKQSHCLGHQLPLSKSTLSTVSQPTFRIIIQEKYLHLLYTPSRTPVQIVLGKVQTEPLWLKEKRQILDALTLGCFIKTVTELK